jgi:hypothetical protein
MSPPLARLSLREPSCEEEEEEEEDGTGLRNLPTLAISQRPPLDPSALPVEEAEL